MILSKRSKNIIGVVLLILAILSLVNASWLAPAPTGRATLIAHRGVSHLYNKTGLGRDDCTATRIRPPEHDIFENTVRSMQIAVGNHADMVEVDIAPTKDGHMVLFHDWTIDCRTDGRGETRDHTLAELKALDIGYGYSADGGKSFPLRGKGIGQIPTVEEGLAALPRHPILFNFKSKNAGEADQLFAILRASGRDYAQLGDAFYGAQGPVNRIRQLAPKNWAFNLKDEAKACTRDYVIYGWTGIIPESCRGGVLVIPINYQWPMWGWPNRLIARMKSVGARVIIMGPYESGKANEGLSDINDLGRIPASFNGYVWVEDIMAVGPALQR